MISRRGRIPRSGIQDGLLEGMKGRFDWNWRIARGLLISTRWILMKKRLETDGESSSWNIVLHLPSLSSISFSLSLSFTRTCSPPHILLSLFLSSRSFFHSSSKMDARIPRFNLSNYHVSRNFDSIFGVSYTIFRFFFRSFLF